MSIDYNRLTMIACCAAMMCLAIAVNLPPVFLTTFGETFGGARGLSEEQLGRIPAVLFISMVFGILLAGPLADRWGARVFAIAGLGFLALALGVLGLSMSYLMLLGAAVCFGLGVACLEVVLSPLVAAACPHRRASAMNRLHLFYSIGAVLTILIGSVTLRLHISWRLLCIVLITFPMVVIIGFMKIPTLSLIHEDQSRISLRDLIRRPYLLAASLAILLGGASEVAMVQWLPAYAERGLGYSKATGGMALAFFSVAMAIGRFTVSRMSQHTGPFPVMIGSCALCTLLYIAACFCPSAPLALTACVCVGFTVACLWPSTLAIAADRYPNGGATMFALLTAAGNVGCTITPWLIGLIAQYTHLRYGILTVALCPAALVLLLIGMAKAAKSNARISMDATM